MYNVKNKKQDLRKFRDSFLGKDIYVKPGETVVTTKPPKESEVWSVKDIEKMEKTEQKIKLKEDK